MRAVLDLTADERLLRRRLRRRGGGEDDADEDEGESELLAHGASLSNCSWAHAGLPTKSRPTWWSVSSPVSASRKFEVTRPVAPASRPRSEEHTSELQSHV